MLSPSRFSSKWLCGRSRERSVPLPSCRIRPNSPTFARASQTQSSVGRSFQAFVKSRSPFPSVHRRSAAEVKSQILASRVLLDLLRLFSPEESSQDRFLLLVKNLRSQGLRPTVLRSRDVYGRRSSNEKHLDKERLHRRLRHWKRKRSCALNSERGKLATTSTRLKNDPLGRRRNTLMNRPQQHPGSKKSGRGRKKSRGDDDKPDFQRLQCEDNFEQSRAVKKKKKKKMIKKKNVQLRRNTASVREGGERALEDFARDGGAHLSPVVRLKPLSLINSYKDCPTNGQPSAATSSSSFEARALPGSSKLVKARRADGVATCTERTGKSDTRGENAALVPLVYLQGELAVHLNRVPLNCTSKIFS